MGGGINHDNINDKKWNKIWDNKNYLINENKNRIKITKIISAIREIIILIIMIKITNSLIFIISRGYLY